MSVPDFYMGKSLFYRRHLSPFLVALFLLLTLGLPCGAAPLPVAAPAVDVPHFTGLDRHYELSFLWFDRLATGQLSFARDPSSPQHFRAILEARTLGIAAWLTGDRVQRYETLMELTPQGRLLPLEYSSIIHKKKGSKMIEQTKLYSFVASTRTILMTRTKNGKKGIAKPVQGLGKHFPVDFLTAGFNFISGVDGPIRVGDRKEIVTFTDQGEKKIIIQVLRPKEWPKDPFFSNRRGTLLKVTLPTEILDTSGGSVYALLDDKLLPQRVIVENVLEMGNVQGKLLP